MEDNKPKSLYGFLLQEKAHTFNYVFASVLFYAFGIPIVSQYGYSTISYDDALKNADPDTGALMSGRYGQGAFPMTLMLYIVASFLFFQSMKTYFTVKAEDKED